MACRPLELELQPAHAEPTERRTDGLGVGPGVEQRAEQHVAGDTADAVEVQRGRHAGAAAERAMRAAIVPAPKPSSMLTTATPAAHEHSIASSALTPPSAAP